MFAKNLALPFLLAAALAPAARANSDIELRFGQRTNHAGIEIRLFGGHEHGHGHEHARTWVPAHYETQLQKVWVDGVEQKVWVAPVYDWRYDPCGRPYKVQLEVGHWKTICQPGHFESRRVQVWVCGHWQDC
ncbi:MAG: hypothetical protein IPJ19_12815 [Planctomycetes bacterium]|nr:hypothetical protein [Planctomycetota bacterium]